MKNPFSGLFRARDKPVNSLNGSGYRFFLGGSTAGKAVTEQSAMQMTAVYACVRILSEAIAGLPLHLYRYNDDGGKEKAERAENRQSAEAVRGIRVLNPRLFMILPKTNPDRAKAAQPQSLSGPKGREVLFSSSSMTASPMG